MGCEQSNTVIEPQYLRSSRNRSYDETSFKKAFETKHRQGRFLDDLIPIFFEIDSSEDSRKYFYNAFSQKIGELWQITITDVEKQITNFIVSDELRVKFSKIILLNILNFIYQVQKSGNWKNQRVELFRNLSKAQLKIIEFLKFKYPRNKKNFTPTELLSVFQQVNQLEHTSYDLLVNSNIFFDYQAVRDYQKKQVISKIKLFLNRLINESNRFYDHFRIQMEKIFEGKDGIFKIGRKIPENVNVFVDTTSENIQITSPQIFRIIMKWILGLQQIFLTPQEKLKTYKYFKIVEEEQDQNFNTQYSFFPLFTGKTGIISILSSLLESSTKMYEHQQEEHEVSLANFNDTLIKIINKKTEIPEINQNDIKTIKYSHYIGKYVSYLAIEKLVNMITELTQIRKKVQKKCRKPIDLIRCQVSDLLRCQFLGGKKEILKVFQTMKKMENSQELKIIRIKNRFSTPLNDCLINYVFTGKQSSFLICQIQLVLQQVNSSVPLNQKINEELNHILYEIERSIFRPTAQMSLLLAYNDTMMGYQRKIRLVKDSLQYLRCPQNQILSCQTELNTPYICSLCTIFYPGNQNKFPIHRCINCNFYVCPTCIFDFDPQLKNQCYEKEITQFVKQAVNDMDENQDDGMFFFNKEYFSVEELKKRNRNIIDCLEEEMKERQKTYAFIFMFKNGKRKIIGYSTRNGHIYPIFYDFLPRNMRKNFKEIKFGPFDIVLFLADEVKAESRVPKDNDEFKTIIPQIKITKKVSQVFFCRWGDYQYLLDVGEQVRDNDCPTSFHSVHSINHSISTSVNRQSELQKALAYYKTIQGRLELDHLDISELSIKTLTTIQTKSLRLLKLKANRLKNIDILLNNYSNLEEIDASRNQILKVKIQKSLTKIRIIDLTQNFIQKIQGFTQSNLPKLKSLNLQGNVLESIPQLNLNSLIWLNFNNNKLKSISSLVSSKLPKLRKLSLSNNNISVIPEVNLPNLQEIQADNNQLINLSCLENYNKIEQISFIGNKITEMPKLDLQSLEVIKLRNNKITSLEQFKDSFLPKLINLDLSKNLITELPTLEFQELFDLNLSENKIKEILYLEGSSTLCSLKWLDLSQNQIVMMKPLKIEQLQILNCSNNKIEEINFLKESQLPLLQEIDISKNKIQNLNALKNFPQIQFLNFEQNSIECMKQFVEESNLPNLKNLILTKNKIKEFYPCQFNSLAQIRLNENKIVLIHQIKEEHLVGCKLLDLSKNQIKNLPIMYLQSVQKLLLNHNSINDLSQFKNSSLPCLQILDLTKNSLTEFPAMNLQQLTHLILTQNKLSSMKGIAKSNLSNLEEISLQKNCLEKLQKLCMNSVMYVNVSENQINNIDIIEDWETPEMNWLNFNKNKINSLCPFKSKGLSSLILSNNQITNITEFCLKSNLPKLILLNLNNNQICQSLPPMKFQLLKTLTIIKNKISNITNFVEVSKLPRLNILKFSINNIQQLPQINAQSFPQLRLLELNKNQIVSLQDFAFSELKKLKDLNLQQNAIVDLPKLNFKNLVTLNLETNKIQGNLEDFQKSELPNLEKLILKNNQINQWPEDLYLEKLKTLNLCENYLEEINGLNNKNLPNLIELNIRTNKLKPIKNLNLPKLVSLYLDHTKQYDNPTHLKLQLKENNSQLGDLVNIIIQQSKKAKKRFSKNDKQNNEPGVNAENGQIEENVEGQQN